VLFSELRQVGDGKAESTGDLIDGRPGGIGSPGLDLGERSHGDPGRCCEILLGHFARFSRLAYRLSKGRLRTPRVPHREGRFQKFGSYRN
jgi:hypothetical protein